MRDRLRSTQEKYPEFVDDQRHFFDELITGEWHTYQNAAWDRSRRFEVDCLFRLISPRTILDVGCGCGFHDVLMAEKAGVESVVGIDYSEKSIETANLNYPHHKVQRRVEDVGQMPADEKFELVASFQVIEHLKDAAAFLRDCLRQSGANGYIAVVTPNRLRFPNRVRILARSKALLGDPQHYREYVADELIALGQGLGLKYFGGFAYGLSLRIPGTDFSLLPAVAGLQLGRLMPPIADCFCVIFRNSAR